MPTSIAAVLVLVLAVLPGRMGAFFFEHLSGRDWRERDWHAALRLIGFSVLGLTLYSLCAAKVGWPPPVHVVPSEYEQFTAEAISRLSRPFAGHVISSMVVGIAAGYCMRVFATIAGITARVCAWDTFVADLVQGRWVVVTLKSGDVYAGYIAVADTGVAANERDFVLRAPSRFDESTGHYCGVGFRDLFVPAQLVDSIATVLEPDDAGRVVARNGVALFQGAANEGSSNAPAASAAAH